MVPWAVPGVAPEPIGKGLHVTRIGPRPEMSAMDEAMSKMASSLPTSWK